MGDYNGLDSHGKGKENKTLGRALSRMFSKADKKRIEELQESQDRLNNQLWQQRRQEEERRLETQRRDDEMRAMKEQLQRVNMDRAHQEIAKQEVLRREDERKQQEQAQRLREKQRHEERMKRMRAISPETLRNLRDLIRQRYELDVEIWGLRGVRRPDRFIVIEKMEKADAVLKEIMDMIGTWEGTKDLGLWTPKEWEKAEEIRERLEADVKRWWVTPNVNPPWEDDDANERRFFR